MSVDTPVLEEVFFAVFWDKKLTVRSALRFFGERSEPRAEGARAEGAAFRKFYPTTEQNENSHVH